MALFRLGSFIPIAGRRLHGRAAACIDRPSDNSGVLGLVNLFSGGALLQLSIFALGIMPYITASIIVQLLTVVIPRFETLKKEGQAGHRQADPVHPLPDHRPGGPAVHDAGVASPRNPGDAVPRLRQRPACPSDLVADDPDHGPHHDRRHRPDHVARRADHRPGIGNGMSLLIFTSIAAGFPTSLWAIKTSQGAGRSSSWSSRSAWSSSALVVFVEQCQRRVPVQYAKRMIGRRHVRRHQHVHPDQGEQAGVIPVIFASSLLYLPALLAQFQQRQARRLGQSGSRRNLVARRPPALHARATSC